LTFAELGQWIRHVRDNTKGKEERMKKRVHKAVWVEDESYNVDERIVLMRVTWTKRRKT
jgi:hypothetical protein